jgi:hypothetical protein
MIKSAGKAPADWLFHHHPTTPVKGGQDGAADSTIHDAAACSDVLRAQSPNKSFNKASGSNAAVKLHHAFLEICYIHNIDVI